MKWTDGCGIALTTSAEEKSCLGSRDWINFSNDHFIGVFEGARKLVEERLGARIGMRLPHRPNPMMRITGARRGQRGFDLGRMMSIIVNDNDAALLAFYFEFGGWCL